MDYAINFSKPDWLRELIPEAMFGAPPASNCGAWMPSVRLWLLNLQACPALSGDFWPLLSVDERQRAEGLPLRQQQRFAIVRGSLRCLLGEMLDQEPQSLQFVYGPRGKPVLVGGELTFNLSHSAELALFAIGENNLPLDNLSLGNQTSLGIDIERIRPSFNYLAIARRFFAPIEVRLLQSRAASEQALLFWQLWTAKEACLKALGWGVFPGLSQIELAVGETGLELSRLAGHVPLQHSWRLLSFTPALGYQATLAVVQPVEF